MLRSTTFTARLSPSGHEGEPLVLQVLKDLIIYSHTILDFWSTGRWRPHYATWTGPANSDIITRTSTQRSCTGRTAAVRTRHRRHHRPWMERAEIQNGTWRRPRTSGRAFLPATASHPCSSRFEPEAFYGRARPPHVQSMSIPDGHMSTHCAHGRTSRLSSVAHAARQQPSWYSAGRTSVGRGRAN